MSDKFKFDRVDNGNARVYYKRNGYLYCFQELPWANGFSFNACSKDGEPSHEIHETPTLDRVPEFADSTSVVFRKWIIKQERKGE